MEEPVQPPTETTTETTSDDNPDYEGQKTALQEAVNASIEAMEGIMITSIQYNTQTTAITTLLGQNANRAAKQTPQG